MRLDRGWLVVAFLLLSVGAGSAAARPAGAPAGTIVFARADAGGRYGLWTVTPGSQRLRLVTRGCGWDWFPAWSPDGRWIAFARGCGGSLQPAGSGLDLYVVRADGKGLRRLVHTRTNDEWPTWSPDGSHIAFVSGEPQWSTSGGNPSAAAELWVVGADGHGLRRLTHNVVQDASPAWSPDGEWIAVTRVRGGHGGIWLVSADGSRARSLGVAGGEAAWSPDGARLAFARSRSGVASETVDLYVAHADGSAVRRLTHEQVGVVSHHPSWSPDGSSIVYMSNRGSDRNNLWIIGANGRGARQLSHSPLEDADPEWSRPG